MKLRRILVVDDDQAITHLLKQLIKHLYPDNEITIAGDGLVALQQARQHRFDLVLTDYHMPRMDGLVLADNIHQFAPQVLVVLMSGGMTETELHETVRAHQLDSYLTKPFTLAQIDGLFHLISQKADHAIA